MDFIKLHKAFEVLSESKSLESGVQLLWYKLVAIANAAYWPEDLSPANITLMSKTKMSEKTLINNRNKLVQYGLIEYRSRGTQKAGIYKIIDITESELTGNITANREINRKQTGSKPAVNEGVNGSTYINKTKQDKTRHGSSEKRELKKDAGGAVSYWLNQVNPAEAPKIMQDIEYWVQDFGGSEEIVKMAIDEMLRNGARSYNYLAKILKSWESKKLDSADKVTKHLQGYYQENKTPVASSKIPVFDEEYLRKEAEKYGVEWEE